MKLVSILTCALAVFSLPSSSDASAAAGAALKALKSMDYRFFVAGGTCAAFSHGITCPIDVVKVRFATLSFYFVLIIVSSDSRFLFAPDSDSSQSKGRKLSVSYANIHWSEG